MIFIKINDVLYPATVNGKTKDLEWDSRESKCIKLEMNAVDADEIFKDGIGWAIVEAGTRMEASVDEEGNIVYDENGNIVHVEEEYRNEYDNSEYCVLGDIVMHLDGTCTVKMGKETAEEKLITMMYGGVE